MVSSGSCSLIIKGDDINIGQVGDKLELTPTRVVRKGEVMSSVVGPSPCASWSYDIHVSDDRPPYFAVDELLTILLPKRSFLEDLSQSHDVSLRLYIQSDLAQISFDLPIRVIRRLADMGLRVEFSILSWGGVEDE